MQVHLDLKGRGDFNYLVLQGISVKIVVFEGRYRAQKCEEGRRL